MEATCKQFRKRSAILDCVRASHTHPSAEAVYASLKPEYPDLSLGTIYRNLALFKQQGLIVSLGTVNGVERFDGDIHPHVHFICNCCGGVSDLPELEVPPELSEAAARSCGGRVDGSRLSFSGVCRACLERKAEGGESA